MRWEDGRRSDNVEDRRSSPISRKVLVGGSGGIGLLVIVLLGMFFGFNPGSFLQNENTVQTQEKGIALFFKWYLRKDQQGV
jgi:uncharacterized protein